MQLTARAEILPLPGPVSIERPPITNVLMLVREWDRYMAGGEEKSPATRRLYKYGVLRFLAEEAPADLLSVTEEDLARFLSKLGRGTTARQHYARGLQNFFRWCFRRGHLPLDPSAALIVNKPALPPVASLSDEELLGHSNVAVTSRYLATTREERRKAVERL